jgi:hypothetical protein
MLYSEARERVNELVEQLKEHSKKYNEDGSISWAAVAGGLEALLANEMNHPGSVKDWPEIK